MVSGNRKATPPRFFQPDSNSAKTPTNQFKFTVTPTPTTATKLRFADMDDDEEDLSMNISTPTASHPTIEIDHTSKQLRFSGVADDVNMEESVTPTDLSDLNSTDTESELVPKSHPTSVSQFTPSPCSSRSLGSDSPFTPSPLARRSIKDRSPTPER